MESDFYTIYLQQSFFIQSLFIVSLGICFIALLLKDILVLRILLAIGSSLLFLESFIFHTPLFSAILFLLILSNGVQLINLIVDHFSLNMPEDLRSVYHDVFNLMRPNEFLKLMKLGEKVTLNKNLNEYIFHKGESKDILMFILKGDVLIQKGGLTIATLGPNAFVGEMHYLTKNPMSADVKIVNEVTVIRWYHEQLDRYKMNYSVSYSNFLGVLSQDLIYKIQNTQMGDS